MQLYQLPFTACCKEPLKWINQPSLPYRPHIKKFLMSHWILHKRPQHTYLLKEKLRLDNFISILYRGQMTVSPRSRILQRGIKLDWACSCILGWPDSISHTRSQLEHFLLWLCLWISSSPSATTLPLPIKWCTRGLGEHWMVYKLHAAKDPLFSAFLPTLSTEHWCISALPKMLQVYPHAYQ